MRNGVVERAVRQHVREGQTLRLKASNRPFLVGALESDSIVLLFGKSETPTRFKWDWLEGVVPFLDEHGAVPIGGSFSVSAKQDTLDAYLKTFTKRATANWVAALLEESGVIQILQQGRQLAVTLSETAASNGQRDADMRMPDVTPVPGEAHRSAKAVSKRAQFDWFSSRSHLDAVLRRRIKFVVEKGAMARLFRRGTHTQLQMALFRCIRPSDIASRETREAFDQWLNSVIQNDCWVPFARNSIESDRWAYFAKLVNIIIYEITSNRELFPEQDWSRVRWWLHLPLDSTVFDRLKALNPLFPVPVTLRNMTRESYQICQEATRRLAQVHGVPPIWFEDAYSN